MSFDSVISMLQVTAIIGSTWTGWRCRGYIKNMINLPTIKPYKDKLGFKPTNLINEDVFCGITGSLTGILLGRILWPIAIPYSLLMIEKDHGSAIRKFLKDTRK